MPCDPASIPGASTIDDVDSRVVRDLLEDVFSGASAPRPRIKRRAHLAEFSSAGVRTRAGQRKLGVIVRRIEGSGFSRGIGVFLDKTAESSILFPCSVHEMFFVFVHLPFRDGN